MISSLCFYDNSGYIFSDVNKISGSFTFLWVWKSKLCLSYNTSHSYVHQACLLCLFNVPADLQHVVLELVIFPLSCLLTLYIVCVVFWYWSSWLVDVCHILFDLGLRFVSFSVVGWIWFWFLSKNDLIMCRFLLILLCLVHLKNIYWYVPHMLQWSLRFPVLCFKFVNINNNYML